MALPPCSLRLTTHLPLGILISLAFCACAAAGFSVHPVLQLPTFARSVPEISSIVCAHLTPPFLFVLLNLLVVALVFKPHGKRALRGSTTGTAAADDRSNLGPIGWVTSRGDYNFTAEYPGHVFHHNNDAPAANSFQDDVAGAPTDFTHHNDVAAATNNDDAAATNVQGHDAVATPSNNNHTSEFHSHGISDGNSLQNSNVHDDEARITHKVSETRICKHQNRRSRNILRSVSDCTILIHGVIETFQKTPAQLRPYPRLLKKAGTFESALRHRKAKPVVVVRDPPEGSQGGEEDVDRKAEEFIGRFYQRIKLQR